MTKEELDKIKKHLLVGGEIGLPHHSHKTTIDKTVLDQLIRGVESLQQQLSTAHAFHDLVVKERNYLSKQVKELDAVRRAAADWIDCLEAKGGHYNDGVPGELMDALDRVSL